MQVHPPTDDERFCGGRATHHPELRAADSAHFIRQKSPLVPATAFPSQERAAFSTHLQQTVASTSTEAPSRNEPQRYRRLPTRFTQARSDQPNPTVSPVGHSHSNSSAP